ncbi:unnamed protein product, partial [Ranitomeya imitator]
EEDPTKNKVKDETEEEAMTREDQPCVSDGKEEIPGDVSTDGSRRRNPPERCPRPLYPQDCPEENHNIPEDHQGEDLIDIKVEVIHGAQEAIAIWADQQDGSRRRNPPERCPRPLCPQDCPEENHNIPEDHQVTPLLSSRFHLCTVDPGLRMHLIAIFIYLVRSASPNDDDDDDDRYVIMTAVCDIVWNLRCSEALSSVLITAEASGDGAAAPVESGGDR